MHLRIYILTAFILIAVLSMVSGCCMKRDIVVIDDKINNIRATQRANTDAINRLDSLLSVEGEESTKLRAEIRSTISEMLEQFRMLQANMSDLNAKVDAVAGSTSPPYIQPPILTGDSIVDTTATSALPGIDCQNLYDDSFTFVVQGKYDEAIAGFSDFLKYCGSHSIADDARYWIAESYYSMDNFKNAISEFDMLISEHPQSEKLPMAFYKMARSHEELGQKQDAIKFYQKIVDDFPNTFEAEQAEDKLEELK